MSATSLNKCVPLVLKCLMCLLAFNQALGRSNNISSKTLCWGFIIVTLHDKYCNKTSFHGKWIHLVEQIPVLYCCIWSSKHILFWPWTGELHVTTNVEWKLFYYTVKKLNSLSVKLIKTYLIFFYILLWNYVYSEHLTIALERSIHKYITFITIEYTCWYTD